MEVFGSLSHWGWIDNFTKSDLGDKGKVVVSNTNEPRPDFPLGGIVVESNYQPLFYHLSSDSPHQATEMVNTEDNLGLRTISGQVGGEVGILEQSTRDNANVLITTSEVSQIADHIIDDVMANATNDNVFDDEDGIHSTFHNHFNSIFCDDNAQDKESTLSYLRELNLHILSDEQRHILYSRFSDEEIKDALFSMGPLKVPGPDD